MYKKKSNNYRPYEKASFFIDQLNNKVIIMAKTAFSEEVSMRCAIRTVSGIKGFSTNN